MHSKKQKALLIGYMGIVANLIFWGIAPSIIKYGLDSVPYQVFLFYRFLIAVTITTPIAFFLRKSFIPLKNIKNVLQIIGIGIFSTLNLGVLFYGMTFTTSSAASVITMSVPLLIVIGSALFLKERITKHEILGVFIAMAGTFVVVAQTPTQAHAPNPLLGNVIVAAYNFIWTTGVLLMKKYAQKYSPFVFGYTGWLIGFITFGVITVFTYPTLIIHPEIIFTNIHAVFPIAYMAIFGSVIAFTAYQVAQKYLDASKVSIFTYLETVIAVPVSVIWLKESLSPQFALGACIIIFGVVLAEIYGKSRKKKVLKNKYAVVSKVHRR